MNIIWGLIISVVNYKLLCKDAAQGIVLFCVLLVCCPVFFWGGLSLQYSYVFLPFLYIWHKKYNKCNYDIASAMSPFVWVFLLTLFATVLSLTLYNVKGGVAAFAIVGTVKSLFIINVLSKTSVFRDRFIFILTCIILINSVVLCIEFNLLKIWSPNRVLETWMRLFGNMGNTGSLESTLERGGSIGRLHGTFTTSSLVGSLSMLGIGIFIVKYFQDLRWGSILMVLCSLFVGLCSSSKRFFLGGVAVLVFCLIIRLFWIRTSKKDYKLPVVIFFLAFIVVVLYNLLGDVLYLDYYLQYLTEGNIGGSLETRFGEDGAVNAMKTIIVKYWLTGLGEFSIKDVNVTDSQFYCTFYKSGILGVALYFGVFYRLALKTIRLKKSYVAIILFLIVFEFFISTEFFSPLGLILLSYVICSLYQNKAQVQAH
ncbi:hypothetical protein [Bacteroides oleiciplenus]|uniref:O-antigen polymerase n=1 Tax=Bacteroides oleiciplenus YIT 12058 TaxID=742727 RepID=K9EBA2_9BACE|nr:hypothetical protein [Bacteroides oleiciplenus]EKU88237.1 hypothetical protein HMPREF9447_04983 [Bacteroides oleiciplenus YIT 12058]